MCLEYGYKEHGGIGADEKLSLSQYADNLILKGGMFIYTLTEFDSRPTRDIDFLIKNLHGSLENIEHIMRDICNISTGNDFITIEVLGTETISVDKKYPGVKTSFMGCIGKVRMQFFRGWPEQVG